MAEKLESGNKEMPNASTANLAKFKRDPRFSEAMTDMLKHELEFAHLNWKKIIQLVETGAYVHTRDSGGRTLLMLAAKEGRDEACRFLIKNNAEVNDRDYAGKTPLMHAAGKLREIECKLVSSKDNDSWINFMLAEKSEAECAFACILEAALKRINVGEPKAFVAAFRECVNGA